MVYSVKGMGRLAGNKQKTTFSLAERMLSDELGVDRDEPDHWVDKSISHARKRLPRFEILPETQQSL